MQGQSVEQLYKEAVDAVIRNDYRTAADKFQAACDKCSESEVKEYLRQMARGCRTVIVTSERPCEVAA